MEENKIVLPNYENSILNLINSILHYYHVETKYNGIDILDKRLEKEYKLRKDLPTVMIFGGSRGAEGINAAALKAIPQFAKKEYQVLFVTGKVHYDKIMAKDEAKISSCFRESFVLPTTIPTNSH